MCNGTDFSPPSIRSNILHPLVIATIAITITTTMTTTTTWRYCLTMVGLVSHCSSSCRLRASAISLLLPLSDRMIATRVSTALHRTKEGRIRAKGTSEELIAVSRSFAFQRDEEGAFLIINTNVVTMRLLIEVVVIPWRILTYTHQ